jgi:hypothetical protein
MLREIRREQKEKGHMVTYRCVVKMGHTGCGKYQERTIHVKARDILDALTKAKNWRGVKKGNLLNTGASVLVVQDTRAPRAKR